MKQKLITALLAVLLLTGCAPESGVIVHKKYHPSYTWWDQTCYSRDPKSGVCTVSIPQKYEHPATWEFCLDDGKDQGCREVDQITFNKYEIRDQYP